MLEKEYIVVLKKDVDYDQFWEEIENLSPDDGFVPSRRVDIINERPGSLRSCHYSLTDDEAEILRQDPRVYAVEIPPNKRTDIELVRNAVQPGTWRKTSSVASSDLNWGMLRGVNTTDPWQQTVSITEDFPYTLTGKGVDVVISDTGITVDHPEWEDENGNSRLQLIDWYAESGLPGIQNANHYRDFHGHGSHCAGTVAGKTMGWAKEARIYALKVDGLEGSGDEGTGISIFDCFDVIKEWHKRKPIDPETGYKRPTVVNMSWGYGGTRSNLLSGVYRGSSWTAGVTYTTSNQIWSATGIFPPNGPFGRFINVRVASVDADLEELIDAGVHVCIAAGNSFYYIAQEGDQDWNNRANFGFGNEFYHRGSSPYSTNAFIVGNLDITYQNNLERKASSSCCGPGVDIYAPGTQIMSVASTDKNGTNDIASFGVTLVDSPLGQGKLMKISGTSMASPNVAGVIATVLESNPGMTPTEMKQFLKNNSSQNLMYSNALGVWTDQASIQNSSNRILKTPFISKNPISIQNVEIKKK
jgi:subtilisin family serine protease